MVVAAFFFVSFFILLSSVFYSFDYIIGICSISDSYIQSIEWEKEKKWRKKQNKFRITHHHHQQHNSKLSMTSVLLCILLFISFVVVRDRAIQKKNEPNSFNFLLFHKSIKCSIYFYSIFDSLLVFFVVFMCPDFESSSISTISKWNDRRKSTKNKLFEHSVNRTKSDKVNKEIKKHKNETKQLVSSWMFFFFCFFILFFFFWNDHLCLEHLISEASSDRIDFI